MGQAQQESFDAVEGGIEGQPPPDLSHKRGHRLRQGGLLRGVKIAGGVAADDRPHVRLTKVADRPHDGESQREADEPHTGRGEEFAQNRLP